MLNKQAIEIRIFYDEKIGKDKQIRDVAIGAYYIGKGKEEVSVVCFEIEEKKALLEGKMESGKACYFKDISINPEYKNRDLRDMMLNEMKKVAEQCGCTIFQRKAGPYLRSFRTFAKLVEDLDKPFRL